VNVSCGWRWSESLKDRLEGSSMLVA